MELHQTFQIASYVIGAFATIGSIVAGVWAWGAKKAVKDARVAGAAAQVPELEKRVAAAEKAAVDAARVPVLQERLADAEKELGGHRERLRTLERQVAALPTATALADIKTMIARLEGAINTVSVKTEGAAKSADAAMAAAERIEGFFLAKGVKS